MKTCGPSSPSPHQRMCARLLRLSAQRDVVMVPKRRGPLFRSELRHRADTTIRRIEGEIAHGLLSLSPSRSGTPVSVDRRRYYRPFFAFAAASGIPMQVVKPSVSRANGLHGTAFTV